MSLLEQEFTKHEFAYTVPVYHAVPFPHMTACMKTGDTIRFKDVQPLLQGVKRVFLALVTEGEDKQEKPEEIGVLAQVSDILREEDGIYQILFACEERAKLVSWDVRDGQLYSEVEPCVEPEQDRQLCEKTLKKLFGLVVDFSRVLVRDPSVLLQHLQAFDDLSSATDFVAFHCLQKYEDRYLALSELNVLRRAEFCCDTLTELLACNELENSIQTRVKYRLLRRQRDAYLREEMNVIRGELGIEEEAPQNEYEDVDSYEKRISEANLPEEVAKKLHAEAQKLAKIPFGSAEATVINTYLDTCLELPWNVRSEDRIDISEAQKVLDEEHEGIVKVKERVLEFLAVKQLNPDSKGQLLCLVGPPGVGKTSVARSVAHATNRKFTRISLGGIRDEAEIRGHRKTYIGAMPGRIINAIKQAGTCNPVILLDELDKLTADSHGDPASALLEVLDAEQNCSFRDHFIELPFDLSGVFFIATANTLDTIPPALLDRLEVIEMNSYTDREKLLIAKNHLLPRALENHGLKKTQCRFTDEALQLLITGYTHENGVRNLERSIAAICRKTAKRIVSGEVKSIQVNCAAVRKMLGAQKYLSERIGSCDEVGIVNGLAWTSLGGELLRVEVSSVQGSGKLELTGNLGDVMKESAKAAVSYIRKHSAELGIDPEFYTKKDVHIHVPEGAVPKDGPSAGVTLCTALVSELTGKTVRRNIAMTGEITLTGRVLPIGGLREKTMAAYKYGCDTVIIPYENSGDIEDLDGEVKEHLKMIPVKHVSEVINLAVNR